MIKEVFAMTILGQMSEKKPGISVEEVKGVVE